MSGHQPVALLRPGFALGDYPEKKPEDLNPFDQLAERLMRLWQPLRKSLRPKQLDNFVRLVDAETTFLRQYEDNHELAARELRRCLAREGLTDQLVARSFALVRDVAESKLGLRHYDVQLKAGRVLLEGAMAEMETGEGKTLVATLPACTAALAGIPVHVVTANDYLVTRDATAMGPVYRALGLSVGAITQRSTPELRRKIYARDIVYNTSKQLAFDYLRDRIAMGRRRGATYQRIERLHSDDAAVDRVMMRGLCFAIIDEADSVLIDEARTPFVIANERETDNLKEHCELALALAGSLSDTQHYVADTRRRRIELTENGRERVATASGALPANTRVRCALVEQALSALHFFQRDRDYLVRDDRIQIVDPNTGRIMADRSWNRGLHQMIETREGCPITAPRDPLASLTFQRFFRRYLRLSGMTGTAREVRNELWSTYRLPFVRLPTHRPSRRQRLPDQFTRGAEKKWLAITTRIATLHATGRPLLIGTRSVADSEALSEVLNQNGLRHELLNARQDAEEARIVAAAGQVGQITVATNMAGRGTDIALAPEVIAAGGLHVIAVEKNDAKRLDRQLFGRCGRHGEPGSYEVFYSPDDELLMHYCPAASRRLFAIATQNRIGQIMLITTMAYAQARCERRHRNDRRNLSIMQDQLDRLLSFSGQAE